MHCIIDSMNISQLYLCFVSVFLSVTICVHVFSAAALRNHPVITKFGTQRRGLTAYVLPEEEMIKRHFPVKGESLSDHIHS